MKFKSLIALFLAGSLGSSAFAGTNLPFVGTKYFNFLGGMDTTQGITIKKDGSYIIKNYGVRSVTFVQKGKFKNPISINGSKESYRFSNKNVEILDKNKKLVNTCDENAKNMGTGNSKCIQALDELGI